MIGSKSHLLKIGAKYVYVHNYRLYKEGWT